MALRTAWFRPGGRPDRRRVWQTGGLAGLALVIALAIAVGGCSGPVEAWRSLSGASKNDPDPQTAPFSGNLAAGEAAPYPNLASVPPPPVRATNAAERQKLAQSLIADRDATAAQYGPLPPRPAAEAKPAPGLPAATLTSAPAAPPTASPHPRTVLNSVPSGRRAAGEPPEPGPLDSSLQMPQIRSVPEPEAARPPPPPPALPSVPRPAAVPPPAAAVASAMPQPAPPEPVLAPVAPPPSEARPDPQGRTGPKRPPAATTVATLQIPATTTATGAEPVGQDRAQIARVAALYRDHPGTVRVLAHAAAASGGGDPLDSYHAALDRAQAVAKALAEAGIPASRIQTEAAPAAGAKAGRVEIQFTQ